MELIDHSLQHIEVFLDGAEYFALLRPGGMLHEITTTHPDAATTIDVLRHWHGVLIRIPVAQASVIVGCPGGMLVDDCLRTILARCLCETATPTG